MSLHGRLPYHAAAFVTIASIAVACGSDSGGGAAGTGSMADVDAATGAASPDAAAPGGGGTTGSVPEPVGDAGTDAATDAGACVPTIERCNALDDDCDGIIDEDLATLRCGRGICRVSVAACDDGVSATCVPDDPNPDGETCEGTDDDCDGDVDEGCACLNGTHQSCYTDNPATLDVGECSAGEQTCADGAWGACVGEVTPSNDVCDDLDNDCDPATVDGFDETWFGDDCDSLMDTDHCATGTYGCATGVQTCSDDAASTVEVCGNGMDEDCDGSDSACCVTPANSTCADAISIAVGGMAVGDNTCSEADLVPAVSADCTVGDGAGNELTFALAADGTPTSYTIRMTGEPGYDTLLHVHASSACDTTDQLACSDDVPSVGTSEVTTNGLPSGGTYYIVTDSIGAGATFTLQTSSAAINHDTCSTPAPIRDNGTFSGSTVGRTNDYLPPAGCSTGNSASADVVYRLVARSSGMITASTAGSAFDTILWVTTTCGTGSIACNDDVGGGPLHSEITWSATAGTTYYLVIRGFDAAAQGNYALVISGD